MVVILLALAAGIIFTWQKKELSAASRDNQQKTAINAMYYSLEEVFYKQNNYYPKTISAENLTSIDPALFTDPNGKKIGDQASTYRYEPLKCDQDKCQSYTLRANLEQEADFVKASRH